MSENGPKYGVNDICHVEGYHGLTFVISHVAKLDTGSYIYWCDVNGKDNSVAWMPEAKLFAVSSTGKKKD